MMTVHKLSAGDGYRYYTGEVASADVLRDKNRELGDYYTITGMPPGQWVGAGAAELALTGQVNEHQMKALFSGQQLPVTSEELAELLAQKPDKSEAIYALTLEEKRLEYAMKAWDIHLAIKQGKTLEEVGNDLLNGISHQAVSKKIEAYKAAGNDFSKANKAVYRTPENLEELKENFLANYQMTETQQARAQKAAARAAGQETGVLSRRNAEPAHTFDTVKTPYTKKLAEEKARFLRQNDREPTKEEAREIRNRVAGQTFREEHRREPRSKEELKRWVASQTKPQQQTVAGFDLVFTPTKSVSIAWGLGDETLRKGIETAHEKAIQDVVAYLEETVIYTRRGKGGIAQEDVKSGIIATKFRHYDSRNGDPNLHDHLVIANKIQGQDGRWLTLDGRMLYSYNVAASELYNTQIAKHIHQDLGLEFAARKKHGGVIHELAGINEEAIHHFSARRQDIDGTLDKLVEEFIENHGYPPNANQHIKLQQQATLETRPSKGEVKSLSELNTQWVQSVNESKLKLPTGEDLLKHLKRESTKQASSIAKDIAQALATSDIEHAHKIIARLEESRSTWRKSNIEAEAQRYFRGSWVRAPQGAHCHPVPAMPGRGFLRLG